MAIGRAIITFGTTFGPNNEQCAHRLGTPMWTTPHRSIERGLRSGVGGPHGSAVRTGRRSARVGGPHGSAVRTGRRSTEHRVHDAAPGALVAPDVLAQSLQLQDLRV